MSKYQVAYDGQILTEPDSFEVAATIAAGENADALVRGHVPAAEVVLAPESGSHEKPRREPGAIDVMF